MKTEGQPPENPLFTTGDDWHLNACVGDNGGPYELDDYGRGFFEGGHAAIRAAENGDGPIDVLIYPAAFCYRHGIELHLKRMIVLLNDLLETGETFAKNHQMRKLWADACALHGRLPRPLLPSDRIDLAGKLIGYFDAFDPTGQVFRYPEDIKGNRHLTGFGLINVGVLREQIVELERILDDWLHQAAERIDFRNEMRAEQ